MNKKLKLGLMIVLVLSLTAALVAFRPFGDADEDGVDDRTAALAEALGIDVETLEAAFQAAHEKGLAQAVTDGKITQEQADAILTGEFEGQRGQGKYHGAGEPAFLADELGITVEELQTAQQTAHQTLLDQALASGDITQEQYDRMQEHAQNGEGFGPGGPGGRGPGGFPGGPNSEPPEGFERPGGGRHQCPEPSDSADG
jgi:hypothetical protein